MTFPLKIIGFVKSKGGGIPRNGLIGEWLFSGDANDTSGNGNDGIVTGATLTTNRHAVADSAYLFGVSKYIKVLNNSVFDLGTGDFSFSLWASQDPADSNYLLTKDYFLDYEIRTLNTNETLFILGNLTQARAPIAATPDTWTHYVVTRVSGMVTWYENNVQIGTPISNTYTMTNTKDIFFGARGNLTRWLLGSLDDIRIYNRGLTLNEITQLYNE